jgi:hypothetical protein
MLASERPTPSQGKRGADTVPWSMRALIARHKLPAAGVALVVLITVALFVVAVLGPRNGAVGDSASCTQWGSSSQSEQQAYAERYLGGHGNVPQQAPGVSGVEAAVNAGCMAAFANDEEDTVTVLDAIEKRY